MGALKEMALFYPAYIATSKMSYKAIGDSLPELFKNAELPGYIRPMVPVLVKFSENHRAMEIITHAESLEPASVKKLFASARELNRKNHILRSYDTRLEFAIETRHFARRMVHLCQQEDPYNISNGNIPLLRRMLAMFLSIDQLFVESQEKYIAFLNSFREMYERKYKRKYEGMILTTEGFPFLEDAFARLAPISSYELNKGNEDAFNLLEYVADTKLAWEYFDGGSHEKN